MDFALTHQQGRAALLVKLVQLLKLKKNCSKSTVDFLLCLLNDEEFRADWALLQAGENFYLWLNRVATAKTVVFNDKEVFVLAASSQVF